MTPTRTNDTDIRESAAERGPAAIAPVDRHRRLLLAGAISLAFASPSLMAQGAPWPSNPIHFIVPFTPGSGTDVMARTLGQELEKDLKQTVIIDNKPGAGGTLGASQVVAAPADGYTILIHSAGHVANAALYPSLKYDTIRDFTPITMIATLPNVLVTSPGKDFKTVQDLVAKAKASPGKYMYASAGNGSATHMNAEKFRFAVGVDANHIPFKGTPEALNEVMAGRIDWFFAPLVSALPLIKDGKLQALAVGTPKRSAVLPDVPTTLEAGFVGSDYTFWVGMFVSSKTSPEIVAKLHDETVKVMRSDAVKERLEKLGAEVAVMPQPEFAALVARETSESGALIKKVGMRIE